MNFNFRNYFLAFAFLFIIGTLHSQHTDFRFFSTADGLPQSEINDVFQDEKGYLWIATNGGGVVKYDGTNFELFNNLISSDVRCINESNGFLFFGTKEGLSILDKTQVFNFKCPQINQIFFADGIPFLATVKGIKSLRDLSYIQSEKIAKDLDKAIIYEVEKRQNDYFFKTSNGDYLVKNFPSLPKVLELVSNFKFQQEKATEKLLEEYPVAKRINKRSFNKIILDNQSNTWLATKRGLYKFYKSNFEHFLKGEKINSLNAVNNQLLIGTENNLLLKDSVKITSLLKNRRVNTIKDSNNRIFAGTDKGLVILENQKPIDTLFHNNAIADVLIEESQVWAVLKGRAITRFDYDFSSYEVVNTEIFNTSDGLYDLNINKLIKDNKNRIWFVTQKGFLGYIEDNIVKHLGDVLKQNTELTAIVIHKNIIFLGTKGKEIYWSPMKEELEFNQLNGENFPQLSRVSQLFFDEENNLWIGTHQGVFKTVLNPDNEVLSAVFYGKNKGFVGIESVENAITQTANGKMWFGTSNGLTSYVSSVEKSESSKPKLFLENVEVAYKKVDSVNLTDYASKTFDLSPQDKHISFEFKTVDLSFADEILYRWRLNSTDWSPWSSENKVNYSSLNAGNYLFEAQSKVQNKTSNIVKFNFHIELALIQKLWFRLLIASALLMVLGLLIWNYIKRIKEKNRREQEALKTQNYLLSLEQKALQLQMNPHFVFNVLNGIKAMGVSDTNKMNATVNKFATLLRLTLHNSRQEHITLAEEIKTLKNYIEIEQLMHQNKFDYEILISSDIDEEEILIPPMLIQPFVENAVKHGISSIDAGEIIVRFNVQGEFLHCEIQDNGIGIEVAKKQRKKNNHQSVAIEVTKERIVSLTDEKSFKIEQMNDKNNKILGTKVSFKLPFLTDY